MLQFLWNFIRLYTEYEICLKKKRCVLQMWSYTRKKINQHLMSSSLANIITARALGVSSRRLIIFSNSPGLGSRGIFCDWAMQTPPILKRKRVWLRKGTYLINQFNEVSCFIKTYDSKYIEFQNMCHSHLLKVIMFVHITKYIK